MKFSDEYKLTEYYQVQSTIDYITKGKNKLFAGSYGDGIFSILDIDTSVKYSLQGTTQGRYLTGGVLPVRFSM